MQFFENEHKYAETEEWQYRFLASGFKGNRLFLQFIHTLEEQQNFSQRDRGYVASLLTMALHDKLEYFTDVMKTLLGDLVQQYVAKNPKLMLRRYSTHTLVPFL